MRATATVAWLGLVTLISPALGQETPAATVRVLADGDGDFATIQDAINQSPAGATIRVGAGTWNESLEITKAISIEGESHEVTRIVSSSEREFQPSEELTRTFQQLAEHLDQGTMMKVVEALKKIHGSSVVAKVTGTGPVVFRQLSFQRSQPVRKGTHTHEPTLEINNAEVQMIDCAIIESPGIGLVISGDSNVKLERCLVTNCWGTGIHITVAEEGSVEVVDSDIRNNNYAGIRIGSSSKQIAIRRCRIHGTGWHGIRYDGSSPLVEQNVFHTTGVSGIYASGKTKATVKNNLFLHSGISCWYENGDLIQSNTFVGDFHSDEKSGISQGLNVLGASQPTVKNNIFVDCENAVAVGKISGDSPNAVATGRVELSNNLFWNNKLDFVDLAAEKTPPQQIDLPDGNAVREPDFVDRGNRDFALAENSALRRSSIGAQDFATVASPWEKLPGEDRTIAAVAERIQQVSAGKR